MVKKLAILLMTMGMGLHVQAQPPKQKTTKAYMVADAHFDTQWNWDIQTSLREYLPKTMRQNLHLLDNYPDYVFNFEGAVKYQWMKEYYPMEYERVKKYILNGRWHLTGSSWDANETVICSSESWMRNVALGQTFYREEFGLEGTDIFLPDCFGFPGNMPTMMRHCGLIGFSSQKLGWRTNPFYEGGKKYPFTIGLWKGIDGSEVMMTHGFAYGQSYKEHDLSTNERLQREIGQSPLGMVYRYYGTGDTGGSPDIPSVRAVMKGMKGDGSVEILSATSDQIYKDFLPYEEHPELPKAEGEMLMDVHGNGCYTSQAAVKLYNRQNEHLGDAAERAAVTAEWLGATAYPKRQMTETWRQVIWHQFHDDLPGTCIPRAYEFTWNDGLIALNRFSNVLTTSVNGIASRMNTNVSGTPIVLYNAEAFPVKTVAEVSLSHLPFLVSHSAYTVKDSKGKTVASQVITDAQGQRSLIFEAHVPATGAAVYSIKAGGKPAAIPSPSGGGYGGASSARDGAGEGFLENTVYRLTVNGQGNVSSIIDKRNGKEMVKPGSAFGLVVFDDCKSYAWPAWEILKATLDKEPVAVVDNVKVEQVENGPVRKTIRIEKQYGESTIVQYVSLYEGAQADRIDFRNEVNWQSLNALLKMNFPMNVSNENATYDLGLGSVERGNNRDNSFEVYAHEWTDLTDRDGSYGVTILNDSKYGWDKPDDHTLRLSLLYSPKADKGYVYQEKQDFGHHEFTFSLIGHEGKLNKSAAVQQSTILNSPIRAFLSPKHKGDMGSEFSFVASDNDNVIIRALKKTEVGDEYFVRVYENTGVSSQNARITFAGNIVKAVEADGTEKEIGMASFAGNTLNVSLKPFGVRAYRVTLAADAHPSSVTLRPASLSIPFNLRCFSTNEFRRSANFSGGYSYAAELLPEDGLTVDGVPFTFGDKDGENGLSCKGDTIQLPEGEYNRVYLLAASAHGDREATFAVGSTKQTITVPDYSGFYGQWAHTGHTKGYVKPADVAYVGTHRHSSAGDEYYEYTYMFKYVLDVPKGARQIIVPNDENIVLFAATAVNESERVKPAGALYRTNNKAEELAGAAAQKTNLLKQATVLAVSGECNEEEKAGNLFDGNLETKWCDITDAPNFVVFDLGSEKTLSGWRMMNAGQEDASYITRTCLLQVRNGLEEEWKTIDILDGNRLDEVTREFSPVAARYVRLYVVGPTQNPGHDATRIYELEVY